MDGKIVVYVEGRLEGQVVNVWPLLPWCCPASAGRSVSPDGSCLAILGIAQRFLDGVDCRDH